MNIRSKDKLLQSVLHEVSLYSFGEYDPDEYMTVDEAIDSDNEVVSAVGRIIERCSSDATEREIYNEVCNHLR